MDTQRPLSREEAINWEKLSEITQLPVELLKQELGIAPNKELSIAELRTAMLQYLDQVFLN